MNLLNGEDSNRRSLRTKQCYDYEGPDRREFIAARVLLFLLSSTETEIGIIDESNMICLFMSTI